MARRKAAPAQPELLDAPIAEREFTREMEDSYLEYSMSVIVSRALPDVRDGLKPVQRRILWGMRTSGVRADGPFRKCAKVVGEVMGSYHPHGDQSIYDALVRMGQPWSMYVALVDAQGNFGSPGFPPAAMRYTECRMSETAAAMLADIDEDTVDFAPNYDGEATEPVVLPAAFPNLLVNGAAGIAVGMATSVPTHNPLEVIDAALVVLDRPNARLDTIMQKLPGPDFTSGCDVLDTAEDGVRAAYESGSGRVSVRAKVEIEPHTRGATKLVFRNLPPGLSVSAVCDQVVDAVKKGRLQSVSNVVDASDKSGQELQVLVKKGHSAQGTVAELFKRTKLEDTVTFNMRALVDGVPRILGVAAILGAFCDHRMEVVLRRSRFRKAKAEARRHIVAALIKALDRIDEVIAAIRASKDAATAKIALCELLDIDAEQAQAIVDMPLRRLTSLETKALRDELAELEVAIAELSAIIEDEDVRRKVVRDELRELRKAYKHEVRRSRLLGAAATPAGADDEAEVTADIEGGVVVQVRVLRGGWVEVTPPEGRRRTWKEGDSLRAPLLDVDLASSGRIGIVTDDGRAWVVSLMDLPHGQRVAIADVSDASRASEVVWAFALDTDGAPVAPAEVLVATSHGRAKRIPASECVASTRAGVVVAKLEDGARLASVVGVGAAADEVVFVTSTGSALRIPAGEVPVQGRAAAGVRAVKVPEGATVVACTAGREGGLVYVANASGWVKAVAAEEIPAHRRGGKGVQIAKVTPARGAVVAALACRVNEAVFVVDDANKTHETKATSSSRLGPGKHVTETITAAFVLLSDKAWA
ncbi:MAG: DNA topoisomerase (ATP-hydrolyzing) [Acidimicrobiia bacterium]